jgi:hypothetical protein
VLQSANVLLPTANFGDFERLIVALSELINERTRIRWRRSPSV